MPSPDEPKRQRSTKAQLEKYGKNKRQIWNEYGPVKVRVQYLCDSLFAGDHHEMALAAGMCYRHLYRILYGHSRLTIRLAGQLVSRLGVRAEWLLCGSGSVFPWPAQADYFEYAPRVNTCYHIADLPDTAAGTYFLPPVLPDVREPLSAADTNNFETAARSIFAARSLNRPVMFFLDSAAFTDSANRFWQPFFRKRYANMLTLTLAGACADLAIADEMPRPDVNALAVTAAAAGASYGETLCQFGFQSLSGRARSLAAYAFDAGCPVYITTEIGEIPNHTNPAVRVPEIGAALGAASYVDLLALTAQVPKFFGEPGGVIVSCGNNRRAVDTFLSRLPCLKHEHPDQNGFVFVLFRSQDADDCFLEDKIHQHGGHVIYLSNPTVTGIAQLLHSCNDVYAGKLTHT